jgi:isocitrate dehydrogenase
MTLVHKSSSMRFGEGAFRDWGYKALRRAFGGKAVVWGDCGSGLPPAQSRAENNFVDITLRQVLTHPQGSYDFHRQEEGGTLLKKYSEFASTIIDNMN